MIADIIELFLIGEALVLTLAIARLMFCRTRKRIVVAGVTYPRERWS